MKLALAIHWPKAHIVAGDLGGPLHSIVAERVHPNIAEEPMRRHLKTWLAMASVVVPCAAAAACGNGTSGQGGFGPQNTGAPSGATSATSGGSSGVVAKSGSSGGNASNTSGGTSPSPTATGTSTGGSSSGGGGNRGSSSGSSQGTAD